MQMKESQSPKALVSKVTGLGMPEGDKIRNSTSFNLRRLPLCLGKVKISFWDPRNTDCRDWLPVTPNLSSLLSSLLASPDLIPSTLRWGFSIWQETWSQQLDLFIFPTPTSEAKPRPVEQHHTEIPAEGSIWSCLTCSPWAVTMSRDVGHMHSYSHITRPSKQCKTQVLRRTGKLKQWLLCWVRYA